MTNFPYGTLLRAGDCRVVKEKENFWTVHQKNKEIRHSDGGAAQALAYAFFDRLVSPHSSELTLFRGVVQRLEADDWVVAEIPAGGPSGVSPLPKEPYARFDGFVETPDPNRGRVRVVEGLCDEVARLEDQLRGARSALGYYANPSVWVEQKSTIPALRFDRGCVARRELKRMEASEK